MEHMKAGEHVKLAPDNYTYPDAHTARISWTAVFGLTITGRKRDAARAAGLCGDGTSSRTRGNAAPGCAQPTTGDSGTEFVASVLGELPHVSVDICVDKHDPFLLKLPLLFPHTFRTTEALSLCILPNAIDLPLTMSRVTLPGGGVVWQAVSVVELYLPPGLAKPKQQATFKSWLDRGELHAARLVDTLACFPNLQRVRFSGGVGCMCKFMVEVVGGLKEHWQQPNRQVALEPVYG
eukprot:GDKI01047017.1.p1 GENE.GDKI01047017.1~~GDKI01047017.1.p1  ORF type:complete len:236 (-),score=77.81 GDKI01047017.1:591-1298(-)